MKPTGKEDAFKKITKQKCLTMNQKVMPYIFKRGVIRIVYL